MMSKHTWTFSFLFLSLTILHLTNAFDCYYCAHCLNTQRGVRLAVRSEDWCYKLVWRSGPRSEQVVSCGASADCRQDSYNEQSPTIPGIYSGTARYCCRNHLCNSPRTRVRCLFLPHVIVLFSVYFVWY